MENLKIYDRDGNELSITNIVYMYIQDKADKLKTTTEDLYISTYESRGRVWIDIYEAKDNGYDGTNLINLNLSDEVII